MRWHGLRCRPLGGTKLSMLAPNRSVVGMGTGCRTCDRTHAEGYVEHILARVMLSNGFAA